MMLKKRDIQETKTLFELAMHPEVAPYIRNLTNCVDDFYFKTNELIALETEGKVVSRTILDEYEQPIGTISLFDIEQNAGFLATWLGKPYFGKGYNKLAKEQFFTEVFSTTAIEYIFIKIRKTNLRSKAAIAKLPYISNGQEIALEVYEAINAQAEVYDLFVISKEHFEAYACFAPDNSISTEIVS